MRSWEKKAERQAGRQGRDKGDEALRSRHTLQQRDTIRKTRERRAGRSAMETRPQERTHHPTKARMWLDNGRPEEGGRTIQHQGG